MNICFEGPSAVGKTTLSWGFIDTFEVIPEVHYLFSTPNTTSKFWYYEKQVERWQIATASRSNVIFDGDPFQPLWYNWTYGFPEKYPGLSKTVAFYKEAIRERQISFPDLYIVLQSDEDVILRRKQSDETRTRRNFEKHQVLQQSQQTYFKFLRDQTSIAVEFLWLSDIQTACRHVSHLIEKVKVRDAEKDCIDLECIHSFLRKQSFIDSINYAGSRTWQP